MKFALGLRFWLFMTAIAALGLTSGAAYAHDRKEVAKHQFVVGFTVEPPFEGLKNGVDLRVSEEDGKTPVEGLEKTLKVEVTHVPSGKSKVFDLRPLFRDPGHYTADLIPTAPGQYRFRFFGTLDDQPINETFDSGPGRFNDIESSVDLQFPERLPEVREVAGAARGAQTTAQQAQDTARQADDSASSASTLSILGIVLGAIGVVAGGGAAVAALRRR